MSIRSIVRNAVKNLRFEYLYRIRHRRHQELFILWLTLKCYFKAEENGHPELACEILEKFWAHLGLGGQEQKPDHRQVVRDVLDYAEMVAAYYRPAF
jgi:hypothetical protein